MNCKVCKKPTNRISTARTCIPCLSKVNRLIISRVQAIIAKAIRKGELKKLDGSVKCEDCDWPAKVYDHRDYFKPLDVSPVCYSCNQQRGTAKNRENIKEAKKYLGRRRNRDLIRMREDGKTFREIGEEYGISAQRAKQIYDRRAKCL